MIKYLFWIDFVSVLFVIFDFFLCFFVLENEWLLVEIEKLFFKVFLFGN